MVLDLEKSNMKLSNYRKTYEEFTGKLSDINRQIAFAGIALIWLFKQTNGTQISICNELVLPSIFLAAALGCDMLHYIYQSFTWAIFYSYKEYKGIKEDEDVKGPPWINVFSWVIFCLKVLFVIMAYVLIMTYLINHLVPK